MENEKIRSLIKDQEGYTWNPTRRKVLIEKISQESQFKGIILPDAAVYSSGQEKHKVVAIGFFVNEVDVNDYVVVDLHRYWFKKKPTPDTPDDIGYQNELRLPLRTIGNNVYLELEVDDIAYVLRK